MKIKCCFIYFTQTKVIFLSILYNSNIIFYSVHINYLMSTLYTENLPPIQYSLLTSLAHSALYISYEATSTSADPM